MPRVKKWIEKLEVTEESGLSNAQLMLTNPDLRPGETEQHTYLPISLPP